MEAGALKPNLLGFVRPAWSTSVSIGLVWSGRSNPLPDVSRPWLGFRQRGSPSPETYKKTKDDRWHGCSFKQIKAVGWSHILSMRTRGPPRASPRLFWGGFLFACFLSNLNLVWQWDDQDSGSSWRQGKRGFYSYRQHISAVIYWWPHHDFTVKFKLSMLAAVVWILGLVNVVPLSPPHLAASLSQVSLVWQGLTFLSPSQPHPQTWKLHTMKNHDPQCSNPLVPSSYPFLHLPARSCWSLLSVQLKHHLQEPGSFFYNLYPIPR